MKLRILQLSALLAVGLFATAPARAQGRVTAPGVYDVSIVYIPGLSVPGGLPECTQQFDRQTYVGKLTIAKNAGGEYRVSFVGENQDDASLNLRVSAIFADTWNGFALGSLGGRDDALVSIDAAALKSGRVTGRVMGQNGSPGHLGASFGPGGVVERCNFTGRGAKG